MKNFESKSQQLVLLKDIFSQLKDHRRTEKGNIRYSIHELLFVTISGVVSGYHTWESIAEFGKLKIGWLREFLPYLDGVPSHDTLGRFFGYLDTKQFAKCFMEYTKSLAQVDSRVVAIDGKTIRGVASKSSKSTLHIVTAFCQKNRLCLGQEVVDDKSNEITAIPKLLEIITLEGCIVTIDAMGCQTEIAKKIREQKADYILQVKDNQKDLNDQIQKLFSKNNFKEQEVHHDTGHGRIETRTCRVIDDLLFLDGKENWKDLNTIVEIESEVIDKQTGKVSTHKRHYISSLKESAKEFSKAIRAHWSIENNLHWNLDVIFKEDNQLKRKGNSATNFNFIIKMGLGLLEREKTTKKSKNLKMQRASLLDSYRELIMGF